MAKVQDNSPVPGTIEEHYEIGFQYRCEGEYALAKKAFAEVLALDPHHVKARWQLALIKGFEGDFDGSLADLKALVEDAPEDLDVRYDFAMTLIMLGYTEEACEQFREILRRDPAHEKAKQQLAYCS